MFALHIIAGLHDARRVANSSGTSRHRLDDNRVAAHPCAVAHDKTTQHLGARTHHHPPAQRGMALGALVQRCASQRYSMIDGAIVTHFGRLTNHHAHAVIDEHSLAYFGAGVNFNTRKKAAPMGNPARQPPPAAVPATVGHTVQHHGMKARVRKHHIPAAASRRIAFKNALDIGLDARKHLSSVPSPVRTACATRI